MFKERIRLIIPLLWQVCDGCVCVCTRRSSHEKPNINTDTNSKGIYCIWWVFCHLWETKLKRNTRKSFLAVMTPGILMILQIFFGEHRTFAVAIFTIALTLNGGVTAGYLSNGLDIAPNFSGTIFGMANTLSSFGGWASSFMVGVLTNEDVSY